MERNSYTLETQNGSFKISIGRKDKGHINMMTNFEVLENFAFIKALKNNPMVQVISAIHNYDSELNGISIKYAENFSYLEFVEYITDIMETKL